MRQTYLSKRRFFRIAFLEITSCHHFCFAGGEVAVEFTTSDMPADVGEEFTTTTSTVESQDPAHHTVISQSEDGEIHELTINL